MEAAAGGGSGSDNAVLAASPARHSPAVRLRLLCCHHSAGRAVGPGGLAQLDMRTAEAQGQACLAV